MALKLRVNLIGAGKVGQTICHVLARGGACELRDIVSRSEQGAQAAARHIGSGRAVQSLSAMRPAELWLIAVPDGQISKIAVDLAALSAPPALAVHFSGFLSADALSPLRVRGWQVASAHPVMSFADPAVAAGQFAQSLCGVEGDPAALTTITQLFNGVGAQCFPVTSEAKAIYHAAAVIANNLTTVLQAVAQEAWTAAGVPEPVMQQLHAALLRSTLENTLALGPQAALTGPAARGDWDVVTRQQAALAEWHPQAAEAYGALSAMAARLKKIGKTR